MDNLWLFNDKTKDFFLRMMNNVVPCEEKSLHIESMKFVIKKFLHIFLRVKMDIVLTICIWLSSLARNSLRATSILREEN